MMLLYKQYAFDTILFEQNQCAGLRHKADHRVGTKQTERARTGQNLKTQSYFAGKCIEAW